MAGDASYAALLTPRQRLFVQAVIKGSTYSEAYRKAGFKATSRPVADSNAHKLLQNYKVKAAIEGAQLAAAQRAEITATTIVERLEECRSIALSVDPPQVSAAVAAVMGQAKVLGLVIDRSQLDVVHHKPAMFPTKQLELTEDEWQRSLAGPGKPAHNTRNDR
jgi:hypothetical protein